MTDIDHIEAINRQYAPQIASLKSEYNVYLRNLEKLEEKALVERRKLQQTKVLRDNTFDKLTSIQEEIDCDPLPESAQPIGRIQKRDIIKMQFEQYEIAYKAGVEMTDSIDDAVSEAEKLLFVTDRKINDYLKTMDDPKFAIAMQIELSKERVKRLKKLEGNKANIQGEQFGSDLIDELKQQQDKTLKSLQKIAKQRLQSSINVTKAVKKGIESCRNDLQEKRRAVEQEYDSNIADVEALVKSNANKHNRRVYQQKKKLEDSKEEMLKRGMNPYMEFRRETLDAEFKRKEQRIRSNIEQSKEQLAKSLIDEAEIELHRENEKRKNDEYERIHRAEQGRVVRETRNTNYIQSKTIGNLDILDPTGHAIRIDPSKITLLPDHSIGLGSSSRIPDNIKSLIIDNMKEKYSVNESDTGEYSRFVSTLKSELDRTLSMTKTLTKLSNDESEEDSDDDKGFDQGNSDLNNGPPDSNFDAIQSTLPGEQESSFVNTSDKKYLIKPLSKFEQDSLDRARNRQTQRLQQGQTQVVNGRTYHGEGFASKPSELVFQDFDVGKEYRKRFILTNVSYTFNSFKILDLDPTISDSFMINYDRPGRMSAGVSCSVDIIFKPSANEDIITSLQILCDTGMTEIPIRCLIKRCAPKVIDNLIDFGSLVLGQKSKKYIKIMNTQAIPSDILITRLETDDQTKSDMDSSQSTDLNGMWSNIIDNGKSIELTPSIATYLAVVQATDSVVHQSMLTSSSTSQISKQLGKFEAISIAAENEQVLTNRNHEIMLSAYQTKKNHTPNVIYLSKDELYVNGYDSVNIEVHAEPLAVGQFTQQFLITFPQVPIQSIQSSPTSHILSSNQMNSPSNDISRTEIITATVIGKNIPIEIITPMIDMKCCYLNRIYRNQVQLQNHDKISHRLVAKPDPLFSSFIDVQPSNIVIQSNEIITFNVKFTPNDTIFNKLQYFMIHNQLFQQTSQIMIPIKFDIVHHELPLYIQLKAIVTTPKLLVSSVILDYGECYVNQQATLSIQITNPSILPQKIMFTKLMRETTVDPNNGFAVILPNETLIFHISFTPLSSISYDHDIQILSAINESYSVKIKGIGKDLPLQLSSNVIYYQSTPPGETIIQNTMIKNISSVKQMIEIHSPDSKICWITISPNILEIPPGEERRIQIEYCPPIDALESGNQPMEWYKLALFDALRSKISSKYVSIKQSLKRHINQDLNQSNNYEKIIETINIFNHWNESSSMIQASGIYGDMTWVVDSFNPCIIGKWRFPIFFQSKTSTLLVDSLTEKKQINPPLFLRLETITITSEIELSTNYIDFQCVSVDSTVLRKVIITNKSDYDYELGINDHCNTVGPFTVVNALRSIPPKKSFEMTISCNPSNKFKGVMTDMIVFYNKNQYGGHQVKLKLRCHVIEPILSIQSISGLLKAPLNWNIRDYVYDFGHVVINDMISVKIPIHNTSTSSYEVKVSWDYDELVTLPDESIFQFTPEKLFIPANEVMSIDVTYHPKHDTSQPLRRNLCIQIDQLDKIRICLFGRVWDRQLIVYPTNPLDEKLGQIAQYDCYKNVLNDPLLKMSAENISKSIRYSSMLRFETENEQSNRIVISFDDKVHENHNISNTSSVIPTQNGTSSRRNSKVNAPLLTSPSASSKLTTNKTQSKESKNVIAYPTGTVQNIKNLTISSLKINDGRKGKANGSYEININSISKTNPLFQVNPEKGSINEGSIVIDIVLNMTNDYIMKRDIINNSKNDERIDQYDEYEGEIVLKGGWIQANDTNEKRIPLLLRVPKV